MRRRRVVLLLLACGLVVLVGGIAYKMRYRLWPHGGYTRITNAQQALGRAEWMRQALGWDAVASPTVSDTVNPRARFRVRYTGGNTRPGWDYEIALNERTGNIWSVTKPFSFAAVASGATEPRGQRLLRKAQALARARHYLTLAGGPLPGMRVAGATLVRDRKTAQPLTWDVSYARWYHGYRYDRDTLISMDVYTGTLVALQFASDLPTPRSVAVKVTRDQARKIGLRTFQKRFQDYDDVVVREVSGPCIRPVDEGLNYIQLDETRDKQHPAPIPTHLVWLVHCNWDGGHVADAEIDASTGKLLSTSQCG